MALVYLDIARYYAKDIKKDLWDGVTFAIYYDPIDYSISSLFWTIHDSMAWVGARMGCYGSMLILPPFISLVCFPEFQWILFATVKTKYYLMFNFGDYLVVINLII